MSAVQKPIRDPAFLQMAIVAFVGGLLAVAFSIGFPIWAWRTGHPYAPAFSLFSCWGIFAFFGAYACFRTWLLGVTPPPPKPGGRKFALIANHDVHTANQILVEAEDRAA